MTNFFSFVAFKHLYVICLWFSFTVPTYRHFCSHRGDIRVTKSEKKTADALEMFQCTKNKKHRIFTEKPTEFVFDPLHCRDFIRKQFLFPVRTSETIYFSLRSRYTTSIKFSIVVFSLSLSLFLLCVNDLRYACTHTYHTTAQFQRKTTTYSRQRKIITCNCFMTFPWASVIHSVEMGAFTWWQTAEKSFVKVNALVFSFEFTMRKTNICSTICSSLPYFVMIKNTRAINRRRLRISRANNSKV